jgi:hypothetical protein
MNVLEEQSDKCRRVRGHHGFNGVGYPAFSGIVGWLELVGQKIEVDWKGGNFRIAGESLYDVRAHTISLVGDEGSERSE